MPFFTCFCSLVVLLQMPPNKFSSAVIAQPSCLHFTPKDPPRTDRAQTYLGSSPSFQVIYITDGVTDAKQSSYCVPCPGSLTLEGVLSRVDAKSYFVSRVTDPGHLIFWSPRVTDPAWSKSFLSGRNGCLSGRPQYC
jgi:hypothetical protein